MSDTAVEIASQPACWRQAAAIAPAFDSALPRRAERVAVIGCGTSLFMARAYAGLRESLNLGETDAFPASEMPLGRRYDRVLAISRSGTTTEVLDALDRLPQGMATVALTAASTSPLSAVAGSVLVLDFADERSVVQTRFATSALALLRAHLGQSLEPVAADAERALVQPLPEGSLERTQHTFLGRGWTVGLAEEAALKLLEAAGTWTESYPAMEYRHGPISASGPNSVIWLLSQPPPGLLTEIERTGAVTVTSSLDPLAILVLAQRVAVALAGRLGLDPDRPRNLTRSVVLDPNMGMEPAG